MKRLTACAVALGLGACGGLASTLSVPTVVSPAPTAAAVAPERLERELARLQGELERRIVRRDWGVPLQLARGPGPWLRLRLGADETFEPGSAQLRVPALLLYAEIAAVLGGAPVVTHVVGHGDTQGADLATDLSARRAASVRGYLLTREMPAARVRGEGRGAAEPAAADGGAANRRIELVVKPVIRGREPEAWLPPEPAGCAGCAPRG